MLTFFFSCLLLFLAFFFPFLFSPPKPIALGNISDNQGGGAPCTITFGKGVGDRRWWEVCDLGNNDPVKIPETLSQGQDVLI